MTDPRNIRKIDDKRQRRGKTYKKRYRINKVGKKRATATVGVPPEVIEKKAEEAGLSVAEYIKQYETVVHFNGFEGIYYEFVERTPEDKEEGLSE